MNRMRPVLALLFAGLLVFTSGEVSAARSQVASGGTLVICTGDGVVSIPVDDRGRPAGPAHICPDCVQSVFSAVFSAPVEVVRVFGASRDLGLAQPASQPAGRPFTAYAARGPPFLS